MNLDETKLRKIMNEATENGEECGCQLAIYLHGKLVLSLCSGYTSARRDQKVEERTLFPIYSCGKGILATAVHQLVEQGVLKYEDRIADYWPEFNCRGKEDIRLWQVLSHRTGLHKLPELEEMSQMTDWEFMSRKMAEATPSVTPGTACNYQGITIAYLIGETVRRATGKPLGEIIRKSIFEPLGIQNSFFFGTTAVADSLCADVDTTHKADSWCADIFHCLAVRHGFLPSANGCANALALARHYSALVADTDSVRLLKPETVDHAVQMCRWENDPVRPEDTWAKFGLGYALCGPKDNWGLRFGHGGALGAEGFADRSSGMALAFTKNMDLPTHPNHPLRNRISEALSLPERIW